MKTIKAKQTIHGSYGVLSEGQTAEVHHKVAEDLEKRGLVTIEEGGGDDDETPEQLVSKQTEQRNKKTPDVGQGKDKTKAAK